MNICDFLKTVTNEKFDDKSKDKSNQPVVAKEAPAQTQTQEYANPVVQNGNSVVLSLESKAMLAVFSDNLVGTHFDGIIIKDGCCIGTDKMIMLRVPLCKDAKIPAGIETGIEVEPIWVSREALAKAFSYIPKKLRNMPLNNKVYIHMKRAEGGLVKLQVVGGNMEVESVLEIEKQLNASTYPEIKHIIDRENKIVKTISISREMMHKLSSVMKEFGEHSRIVMHISNNNSPVKYEIKEGNKVLADGVFMLLRYEGEDDEQEKEKTVNKENT